MTETCVECKALALVIRGIFEMGDEYCEIVDAIMAAVDEVLVGDE